MAKPHYVIAGAGLAGAVLARELAEAVDCRITIFETKSHIGGHATNGIELGTTSQFDGPLDGGTVKLGQSTNSTFPALTFVPTGMPGNPEVYAQPLPPELYSG